VLLFARHLSWQVMRLGIRSYFSKLVHGAADASWTPVENMCVNRLGLKFFVPQKFLNRSDGKRVSEAAVIWRSSLEQN